MTPPVAPVEPDTHSRYVYLALFAVNLAAAIILGQLGGTEDDQPHLAIVRALAAASIGLTLSAAALLPNMRDLRRPATGRHWWLLVPVSAITVGTGFPIVLISTEASNIEAYVAAGVVAGMALVAVALLVSASVRERTYGSELTGYRHDLVLQKIDTAVAQSAPGTGKTWEVRREGLTKLTIEEK